MQIIDRIGIDIGIKKSVEDGLLAVRRRQPGRSPVAVRHRRKS